MRDHKRFYLGIKALIRNLKGEILLVLKNPKGIQELDMDHRLEYWDFPGGRLKWGEEIGDVLKRELEEEIGIRTFKNNGLFYAAVSNIDNQDGEGGLILFIYECIVEGDFVPKISDEDVSFGWFDNKQASEKLRVNYPEDLIQKLN